MGEQASSQSGGLGGEARVRRGEGDLLAERRARRAAESGEHALMLRAEAAEATVRTLETHVASLQRRLREAEDEGLRMSELIAASQPVPPGVPARESVRPEPPQASGGEPGPASRLGASGAGEHAGAGGPGGAVAGADIEHLLRRLGESESQAHVLARRLDAVQRELADAEQAAAVERAAARRAQQLVHERLDTLERNAGLLGSGLDAERTARERAERVLERIRRGQALIEELVRELAGIVARLLSASASSQAPAAERSSGAARPLPGVARAAAPASVAAPGPAQPARASASAAEEPRAADMATALAEAVERLRARAQADAAGAGAPQQARVEHRHSRSLIGRIRLARKQRRERR